jgi:lipopolysaccharide export system protein LptA
LKITFRRKALWRGATFLGAVFLFWLIWPAFDVDLDPSERTERSVEIFDTVVRGYGESKLRWQVNAKTVWTGYNPFLFRGEAVGPGVIFDDDGVALVNEIFSGQVHVNSKTKILYAYDTVSAYFLPRKTQVSFQELEAAVSEDPVRVTAGGLKYVEASKHTYLTDGVEIIQGNAHIRPYIAAELDNNTNVVHIEEGFEMTVDDMVVSGNRMEIMIDTAVSMIDGVTLLRHARPTTDADMDPRERALREKRATLTADHMRFEQRDDIYLIDVSGNVVVSQDGKSLFGDRGSYTSEGDHISLEGGVRVVLPSLQWLLTPDRRRMLQNEDMKETMSLATTITCDTLYFDADTQTLSLLGNVHVRQVDKEVRCTKLVYDDHAQKIILSGNVTVLKNGEDSLVASSVVVDLAAETYRATGKIKTEFKMRKATQ